MPTRLSDTGDTRFQISADSLWVVYRHRTAGDRIELYSVRIGGGTPLRLNGSLVSGGEVKDYVITRDSSTVVFVAGYEVNALETVWNLFSVDIGFRCGGQFATIVGTNGPDVLVGTKGPDVIHGRGRADVIKGKGGADVICGGVVVLRTRRWVSCRIALRRTVRCSTVRGCRRLRREARRRSWCRRR